MFDNGDDDDDDDDRCDVSDRPTQGDVVQNAEEVEERRRDVCVGHGQQDVIIVITRLFTHLCA